MNKIVANIFFVFGIILVLIILLYDNKKSNEIEYKINENYYLEISGKVRLVSQNRGITVLS